MLARSLPGSNTSSAPPSPRRRLARPTRSRLSSPPSVPEPPLNAEFMGSTPARPTSSHGISETAFVPQYFEKFFVTEKELGRGGKGVVLLVKHVLDGVTLGHFACKRVPVGNDHAWLEKVLMEVQALQRLSHQNLVSYRHVWLEDAQINNFGPLVPCAFILQQYCNGGDIHSYVCGPAQVQATAQDLKERIRRRSKGDAELPRKRNEPRRLQFEEIYPFFKDITEGLAFLHANGFIHRDLKPQNCLLHHERGKTQVLVSDFGEVQYEDSVRKSTGATGTISYCAPEVLMPVSPGGPLGAFTFKSDIFSLGMILHFMCFADLPYVSANVLDEEQENLDELRAEITSWSGYFDRPDRRPDLPSQLYTVLRQLLSIEPFNRPMADDVLRGMRSGGDFVPELRRRTSASPEDVVPGPRVTKIDSPTPNRQKRQMSQDHDMVSPTRQARTRLLRRPSTDPRGSEEASAADLREDNPSSTTAMMRRTSSQGVQRSVPIRRQVSRERTTSSTQTSHVSSLQKKSQLLLPAPPPSALQKVYEILQRPVASSSIAVTILIMKLVSTVQPCLYQGMNPRTFYSIIGVAVMEFCIAPRPGWQLLGLFVLHVSALWYTLSHDQLCHDRWHMGQSDIG